jgi:putative oxidoreductase
MVKQFFQDRKDIGLLILRIGIGISFIFVHGMPKLFGGPAAWERTGKAMANLGISFVPVFWGFMAAITEFGGGILLMLGLFTRSTSVFLAFTMIVAAMRHLTAMDPWSRVFHPIEILCIFIALIFLGAGKFSIDAILERKKISPAIK